MSKLSKKRMLEIMNEAGWIQGYNMDSSYEDIKDEYNDMLEGMSDDSYMHPNGRDYDAEDEEDI